MKIQIDREQKIKLLEMIKNGVFDSAIFPDLPSNSGRTLTKDEAKELWADLDNGEFDKLKI